jgi:2-polyprenyl-3-methyl-5-hydroxy-6-metoxy-1,4-benzoquinol methylase
MATATFQPEGNYYDKYNARNPVSRHLMNGFLSSFDGLAELTKARTAYEFGCGEGHLSVRLARQGVRVRGSDVSAKVVEQARGNAREAGVSAEFNAASIYEITPDGATAELVVCCEVLEHLERPDKALDLLVRCARPWLLVSVPREPIWRTLNMVRGAYWRDLGNTPGHIQHWSTAAFVKFLGSRVDVIQVRKPLPWTMALCRVDDSR